MTFEEWFHKEYEPADLQLKQYAERNEGLHIPAKVYLDDIKRAFLAGLKAQTKWHKVSEQLPTEEKDYLVKLTDGTIDVMAIALDGNLEPYLLTPKFDFYKDVEKWCEIPKE